MLFCFIFIFIFYLFYLFFIYLFFIYLFFFFLGGGGVIPPVHKISKVPLVTFRLVKNLKKTLLKSRLVFKDTGVASAIKESAKYPMTHSSSFSVRYENRALKPECFCTKEDTVLVQFMSREMYCIFFCFAAWFQNSTTQVQWEIFGDSFVRILL